MKGKIVWPALICIMATVVASCTPGETTVQPTVSSTATTTTAASTTTSVQTPAQTAKEMVKDSLGRLVEKPRYGGVFVFAKTTSPSYFDEIVGHVYASWTQQQTHENLFTGDWSKGPTGSNLASYVYNNCPDPSVLTGSLAESWEITDAVTIVFHIRQGVHFHNKSPTNGREVTSDDVVFSLNRMWDVPTAYFYTAYPRSIHVESIVAVDKWTVRIKCKPGKTGIVFDYAGGQAKIVPRDAIDKFGNMLDWKNCIGTGPFLLTDYLADSSITLVRNKDYWNRDPLHPDNRLPYLDGIQFLIIPDFSTRQAAMRAGKIDNLRDVTWEQAKTLTSATSQLKSTRYLGGSTPVIFTRIDKPELPFKDIRVRRALQMGIDREALVKGFYGGQAEMLVTPILPAADWIDMYTPVDKLPDSTKQLFEYRPDDARKLLADAGYPTGFNTEILCLQTDVELLSVIKADWKKIGVNLTLDVKEYAAMQATYFAKKHKEMVMWVDIPYLPFKLTRLTPGSTVNLSMVDDPVINDARNKMDALYPDNPAEQRQMMKELSLYILEQCYYIGLPGPYLNAFWQPWIQNYSGEYSVGYYGDGNFLQYVWYDQAMKNKMTGR